MACARYTDILQQLVVNLPKQIEAVKRKVTQA
jgi:hypothetical protein